jgi:hypothetical protein
MPIKYWIEKDKQRIRAEVSGKISIEDILNAIKDSINDPDFRPQFNILSDHTKIDKAITKTQVLHTTFNLKKFSEKIGGSKWAVVVNKKVSYGMMNMLSVYLETVPMELRAFYSFDEAEEWLAERK